MKDFQDIGQHKLNGLFKTFKRYQLVFACIVIVLCFAIGNDLYRAQAVALKNRDLLQDKKRVVNYQDAVRNQSIKSTYTTDLKRRFLIDPKATEQKTIIKALLNGGDQCPSLNAFYPNPLITTIPYTDTGTTTGAFDDYDLTGDPTACASPTCEAISGGFTDRGATYLGTGTGPDVGYRIRFTQTANMIITLDPSEAAPNADDLALMFYGGVCSNNPADAIVMSDNSGSGNPPDLVDNSESVTITSIPAGNYHIVVDGYTYAGAPASAGAYTLNIVCATAGCPSPAGQRTRRPGI